MFLIGCLDLHVKSWNINSQCLEYLSCRCLQQFSDMREGARSTFRREETMRLANGKVSYRILSLEGLIALW